MPCAEKKRTSATKKETFCRGSVSKSGSRTKQLKRFHSFWQPIWAHRKAADEAQKIDQYLSLGGSKAISGYRPYREKGRPSSASARHIQFKANGNRFLQELRAQAATTLELTEKSTWMSC